MSSIYDDACDEIELLEKQLDHAYAENSQLRATLKKLDDAIFNDPQVIDRAGEWRAMITNALNYKDADHVRT